VLVGGGIWQRVAYGSRWQRGAAAGGSRWQRVVAAAGSSRWQVQEGHLLGLVQVVLSHAGSSSSSSSSAAELVDALSSGGNGVLQHSCLLDTALLQVRGTTVQPVWMPAGLASREVQHVVQRLICCVEVVDVLTCRCGQVEGVVCCELCW
jgi:hypothetical protein